MSEPAETEKSTLTPLRIGPYEIVRKLGSGGMAETFEAVRRRPGGFAKRVCIKRILYPLSADDSFRDEFVQEAKLLAELSHGGIVEAFDYDVDDGRWYIVMQLIDGVDLARLLDHYTRTGRRMPPGVAAHLIAEVAEALHYLHHFVDAEGVPRNIVHRDISPQNIMINRGGEVKLLDLGIAHFSGRPKFTQTDSTKGKLWYMSPEHIEKARGLDARSDLFGLGAVLYEAVTGAPAFREHTAIASHHAILKGTYKSPLALAPHLDPELADFIEQCLSPEKDDRPATGNAFARRLRSLAPHAGPKAALVADVADCLNGTANGALKASSARHFTGDPHHPRSSGTAEPFRAPARASALAPTQADTHLAEDLSPTKGRPPSPRAPDGPASADAGKAGPTFPWPPALGLVVAAAIAVGAWSLSHVPSAPDQASHSPAPAPAPAVSTPPKAQETPPDVRPATSDLPRLPEPTAPAPAIAETIPNPEDTTASSVENAHDGHPRRKASTGAVKVRVVNWGYVWVDGVFKGKGPVVVDRLSPGLHELGASQTTDKPTQVRKVRVPDGGFVEHVFRLNEEMFR
jgi:serine/threonine protein kinase